MRAALLALAMIGLGAPLTAQHIPFAQLQGWQDDDHLAALKVFQNSCDRLKGAQWQPICKFAADAGKSPAAAKAFFEMLFRPTLIGDPPALFTGYFEPELRGSKTKTGKFAYPLYARPKDLKDGTAYKTRAQIEGGALQGQGLELAWLDDPVDVFFMQIQGSGRVILPDGRVMRLGYAGRNGFDYASVGQELVRRGIMDETKVSAAAIRAYVKANPQDGAALLNVNQSYVFFREISELGPKDGPIGAMSLPITPLRSIAVDPRFVPLGAPVWVEKPGAKPINQLMIAQDTGGAIKGAQRADIFFGTGAKAGDAAGTLRDGGRMVQMLPNDYLPTALGFSAGQGG
ncbi:MAG: MltA domain-containing protein [Cypionkella sp.]|nr:MltA domain-containing protein [Cypionkella sp.]